MLLETDLAVFVTGVAGGGRRYRQVSDHTYSAQSTTKRQTGQIVDSLISTAHELRAGGFITALHCHKLNDRRRDPMR
jgi:hypothetical protein